MRTFRTGWRYLACGAVVLAVPGAGMAADAPDRADPARSPSPILLKVKLEGQTPQALASRLSQLLGIEVRLPSKGVPRITIPPGEWTATQILNRVAARIEGSGWQLIYQFSKRTANRKLPQAPISRLFPEETITLQARDVSFSRALTLIQDASACVLRPPERTPDGSFRLFWQDTPLETVLKQFAEAANLDVTPVVLFERDDPDAQAARAAAENHRAQEQTEQQAQIVNRLQQAYGQDPYSEDFPWENIDREGLTSSLAREMGLSFAEVDAMMERVRLEALTRAELLRGE